MSPKVLAVVEPVLGALGCESDPHVWVAWGDDPALRYVVFAPTGPGLVTCHARVNVAGEGPRASGKIVRWNRAQLGELAIETQAGHRIVSFQVEGQVLRGVDAEADRVGAFAIALFAAADGKPLPDLGAGPAGRRGRGPGKAPAKPPTMTSTKAAGTPAGPAPKTPPTGGAKPARSARSAPSDTAAAGRRAAPAGRRARAGG